MKIQTFSIVAGTQACNARCPFCVSRMTGFKELPRTKNINVRNFEKACTLAKMGGSTTVLITGKGEPTLYPEQIDDYLRHLTRHKFPFIELQTNALEIGWLANEMWKAERHRKDLKLHISDNCLRKWYMRGLDTIAISLVGINQGQNAKVYHKDYPRNLALTINYLHEIGFTVRLCLMMQKGFVDTPGKLFEVIDFCRDNDVDQLTARPIRQPKTTEDNSYTRYVREHGLITREANDLCDFVANQGTLLMDLIHGAKVYDVAGQNVCMSDCLTTSADENIRSLIFYSNGRLSYSWQYSGAVLLGGRK